MGNKNIAKTYNIKIITPDKKEASPNKYSIQTDVFNNIAGVIKHVVKKEKPLFLQYGLYKEDMTEIENDDSFLRCNDGETLFMIVEGTFNAELKKKEERIQELEEKLNQKLTPEEIEKLGKLRQSSSQKSLKELLEELNKNVKITVLLFSFI